MFRLARFSFRGHRLLFETVLEDRLKGFKHWEETSYGQQAIDMLAAFGDELDMQWLEAHLKKEAAWDAFVELRNLPGGILHRTTVNA
jgi:hypothetical protein